MFHFVYFIHFFVSFLVFAFSQIKLASFKRLDTHLLDTPIVNRSLEDRVTFDYALIKLSMDYVTSNAICVMHINSVSTMSSFLLLRLLFLLLFRQEDDRMLLFDPSVDRIQVREHHQSIQQRFQTFHLGEYRQTQSIHDIHAANSRSERRSGCQGIQR